MSNKNAAIDAAKRRSRRQHWIKDEVVLFRLPAIEVRQGPQRRLYSFAVDGKRLGEFTTLSRLRREVDEDDESAGNLLGYQRPEVASHIREIRRYLEGPNPMVPNALVIAFDKRVRFEPAANGDADAFDSPYSRAGTLVVPVPKGSGDYDKPGWIVDGQQRTAAVRDADIKSFPLCCVGFIAENDAEQREQFLLVNSAKPLSRSLVYELLPATDCVLPKPLFDRRLPSALLARLNADPESPLRGMIAVPTNPEKAPVKDNSVLRMLANSLSDGALYRHRTPAGGADERAMLKGVLYPFWSAVRDAFPDAWGLPPRRSRLMHGAGIVSVGFLMDAVAERIDSNGRGLTHAGCLRDLRLVVDHCAWTAGEWPFEGGALRVRWDEVQNTPRDLQRLADHLLSVYRIVQK